MAERLPFHEARPLLQQVLDAWGGPGAPVTRRSAGLSVSTASNLPRSAWRAAEGSRALSALLNRIMRNGAARLLRRAQDASRPTYRTGLFLSSWRVVRDASTDLLFVDRLTLENPVPYASYVHRKGSPPKQTVVRVHIRPLLDVVRRELVEDFARADVTRAIQQAVMG